MHCSRLAPRAFLDAAVAQSLFSRVSRSGPTVPLAPAAARVWQPPHPAAPTNTALPAAALALAPVPDEDEPEDELDDEPDEDPDDVLDDDDGPFGAGVP